MREKHGNQLASVISANYRRGIKLARSVGGTSHSAKLASPSSGLLARPERASKPANSF